jgi:hypothetical protein
VKQAISLTILLWFAIIFKLFFVHRVDCFIFIFVA